MLKHHQRIFGAAVAAAAAAAITVTGVATASAAPHARPGASGTEHFQIMSTSATSNTSSIIATGVFTAGGATTNQFDSPPVSHSPTGRSQDPTPKAPAHKASTPRPACSRST